MPPHVPYLPTPPTDPGLAAMTSALSLLMTNIETDRQSTADVAIGIAKTMRFLETTGVVDIVSLPPIMRRMAENFFVVLITTTHGQPDAMRGAAARAAYCALRMAAELYEHALAEAAKSPNSDLKIPLDSGQDPTLHSDT